MLCLCNLKNIFNARMPTLHTCRKLHETTTYISTVSTYAHFIFLWRYFPIFPIYLRRLHPEDRNLMLLFPFNRLEKYLIRQNKCLFPIYFFWVTSRTKKKKKKEDFPEKANGNSCIISCKLLNALDNQQVLQSKKWAVIKLSLRFTNATVLQCFHQTVIEMEKPLNKLAYFELCT